MRPCEPDTSITNLCGTESSADVLSMSTEGGSISAAWAPTVGATAPSNTNSTAKGRDRNRDRDLHCAPAQRTGIRNAKGVARARDRPFHHTRTDGEGREVAGRRWTLLRVLRPQPTSSAGPPSTLALSAIASAGASRPCSRGPNPNLAESWSQPWARRPRQPTALRPRASRRKKRHPEGTGLAVGNERFCPSNIRRPILPLRDEE